MKTLINLQNNTKINPCTMFITLSDYCKNGSSKQAIKYIKEIENKIQRTIRINVNIPVTHATQQQIKQ